MEIVFLLFQFIFSIQIYGFIAKSSNYKYEQLTSSLISITGAVTFLALWLFSALEWRTVFHQVVDATTFAFMAVSLVITRKDTGSLKT